MGITDKKLTEIKAFQDTDINDCPELTDEQLAQLDHTIIGIYELEAH